MNIRSPVVFVLFCCLVTLIALFVQVAVGRVPAEPEAQTSDSQPAADQTLTNLLVGAWNSSEPSGTRIELRADGHYEWWIPYLQSDLAAKTMIQSGKWSVRERTLSLRIEKAFPGHVRIPPGTTFSYDVSSASPEKALLISPDEKMQVKWTRVSQEDEPFWKKAVSYQPPFKMHSSLSPTNAAMRVGDWELYSKGPEAGTNDNAQVVFHLETVGGFSSPDIPVKPLETVADLRSFLDSKLGTDPRGSNYVTSLIKIDGREALMCSATTSQTPNGQSNWQCNVCFFWETNAVWQKSTICLITMAAETRETLDLLTNSLDAVKLLGEKQRD